MIQTHGHGILKLSFSTPELYYHYISMFNCRGRFYFQGVGSISENQ